LQQATAIYHSGYQRKLSVLIAASILAFNFLTSGNGWAAPAQGVDIMLQPKLAHIFGDKS
jgi:hypothetical protein